MGAVLLSAKCDRPQRYSKLWIRVYPCNCIETEERSGQVSEGKKGN